MRAESTPLYRPAHRWLFYLAVAAICTAVAAYLVVVVLGAAGIDLVPEPLFTGPFRWMPDAGQV
jgi:hypothetical protein